MVTALGGASTLLVMGVFLDLPFFVTFTHAYFLFLSAGLLGLLYYLLFLLSGRRLGWPLGVFYLGFYLLVTYLVAASAPERVVEGRWGATVVHGAPPPPIAGLVVLSMMVVPQAAAAMAYFSLFFRTRDATQRYRVAVVSWSVLVWFGASMVATVTQATGSDAVQLELRMLGLAAALAILAAYVPPAAVRRWLGVAAVPTNDAREASPALVGAGR